MAAIVELMRNYGANYAASAANGNRAIKRKRDRESVCVSVCVCVDERECDG